MNYLRSFFLASIYKRLLISIGLALIVSLLYLVPSAIEESDADDRSLSEAVVEVVKADDAKADLIRKEADAIHRDPEEFARYKRLAKLTGNDRLMIADDSPLNFDVETLKKTH